MEENDEDLHPNQQEEEVDQGEFILDDPFTPLTKYNKNIQA